MNGVLEGEQIESEKSMVKGASVSPSGKNSIINAVPVGSDLAALANPTYKGVPPYTGAWKDCAYDPELPGPIYHTDQIRVPTELEVIVREWTKAALLEQPQDVNKWSEDWFARRARSASQSQT